MEEVRYFPTLKSSPSRAGDRHINTPLLHSAASTVIKNEQSTSHIR